MALKLLLVDDDETNVQILEETFHEAFDIKVAYTGEEAVKLFHSFNPDAVLLDIMLPGIDGQEVLRRIRDSEEANGIALSKRCVIIMLTALKDPVFSSYQEGCDDYITKPFESDDLIKKVVEKVREKRLLQ